MIDGDLKTSIALTTKSRHARNHPNFDSILSPFRNKILPVSRTFRKRLLNRYIFSVNAHHCYLHFLSSNYHMLVPPFTTWFYPPLPPQSHPSVLDSVH